MTVLVYRTIPQWSDPETPSRLSHYQFKASASATRSKLLHEADMIRASDTVVEVVGSNELFYVDGTGIRSDRAHLVKHPGVVVCLIGTRHGDLRYASDAFDRWEANLRAVALGLEALRRVERYGIASRGEQYRGWRALPPGTPMGAGERPPITLDYAAAILAGATNGLISAPMVLADPEDARTAYRLAAKQYHPDAAGGSVEMWARVDEAWQLLERHHEGRL
jgi:hypothetical protein